MTTDLAGPSRSDQGPGVPSMVYWLCFIAGAFLVASSFSTAVQCLGTDRCRPNAGFHQALVAVGLVLLVGPLLHLLLRLGRDRTSR